MNSIQPRILDNILIDIWREAAGEFADSMESDPAVATKMLTHCSPSVRAAAARAFQYFWECNIDTLRMIAAMAKNDKDEMVRYVVAGTLGSLCYQAVEVNDKPVILNAIRSAVDTPNQAASVAQFANKLLEDLLEQWPD